MPGWQSELGQSQGSSSRAFERPSVHFSNTLSKMMATLLKVRCTLLKIEGHFIEIGTDFVENRARRDEISGWLTVVGIGVIEDSGPVG